MTHSHVHSRSTADEIVLTRKFEKGNGQHMTMYSAFILDSVVQIMMYHGVWDLPRKLDYVTMTLAFGIEAFLFMFHLHAKAAVEVNLHVLLVNAIMGCVISCVLEAYNEKQILFTYSRCLFVLLQGTWFYQVNFKLLKNKIENINHFVSLFKGWFYALPAHRRSSMALRHEQSRTHYGRYCLFLLARHVNFSRFNVSILACSTNVFESI